MLCLLYYFFEISQIIKKIITAQRAYKITKQIITAQKVYKIIKKNMGGPTAV